MNISIGVRDVVREFTLEVDLTEEQLFAAVDEALSSGNPLTVRDVKGHSVLVPAAALGYVSVVPEEQHRVGFALN